MFEREVALYRRLRANGIHISFVTYGNSSDLAYASRVPGIRVLCNRWALSPAHYERWLSTLHAFSLCRADVFKTNQTDGADVALRIAHRLRKPLIARCGYMWSELVAKQQSSDSYTLSRSRRIEAEVFGTAQRIVVTTPTMAESISQRIAAIKEHITVIPNYVETDRFMPEREQTRDIDVVFVGRMHHVKNVSALLESACPLNVKLLLIGDGSLREELQHRFDCLKGRIEWHSKIPNEHLPAQLNRAKIFVLPSHYEGHPKALIEAMSCGLAVIGANSPGIRELIRHGETGWLCNTDAKSIQTAIQMLLANPNLQKKLGNNARRYVLESYSLDSIVEMELAMLREVIGSHKMKN